MEKKIENRIGFEQKPRFIPRTKYFCNFFIIFLCYSLLRIVERGKRQRIGIFVEKKYLKIRFVKFTVRLAFVANNLLKISSLSWNKRRYSRDREHRMCACYTSGPEGRKVAPVLCNRIVWPLWARVLYKLHDFSNYVICTYVNRTVYSCSWIVEQGKEQTRRIVKNLSTRLAVLEFHPILIKK